MRVSLIETDDPRWERSLANAAFDFYHLPAYAELAAREEGGSATALHVSADAQELLLPLIIREIPGGGRDLTSPYGYPGPLIRSSCDLSFLNAALGAGVRHLADQGFVSLFVRMHPLLCPDPPTGVGTVVHHGPTVVVDLRRTDDQWWSGMRKSHRQQVVRALRDGHRGRVDEEFKAFGFFKAAYHRTMERLGAEPSYYFSDSYFDDLRASLGDRLKLVVLERRDRVWAAGLFVEVNGMVQTHLSADDGSYRRGGAKKLLYAFVRDWARARGDRWFHLGGGAALESSLLSFKMGFSPDRRPFNTLRVILREDAYAALAQARSADAADATGYFPAYRRDGRSGP